MPKRILRDWVAMFVGGVFLYMDDRKAFNFYRSYYDIALQLNDDDRYQFLMALLDMQFTGETKRQLSPMAQFAFISQKHSIEAQINGYLFKAGKAPTEGGKQAPSVQEKGKEKGQEKGKGQGGSKILTFGTPSNKSFAVDSKYISDNKCKVYYDGFKEYCNQFQMGTWFPKEYLAEIFWQEWNGKLFSDHKHLNTVMIKIINNKNG